MPVVSISMPQSLLEELDEFIAEHGYTGRSEAMREGARELLAEGRGHDLEGSSSVCLATAAFDHGAETTVALSALRREYTELVVSSLHSHAADRCLEVFVLDGGHEETGSFLVRLRAVNGVESVEYVPLTVEDPVSAG